RLAAVDHQHPIQRMAPASGFDQQRDIVHQATRPRLSGRLGLRPHGLGHQGVDDLLELVAGLRMLKNMATHAIAVQRAVGVDEIRTELAGDGSHGRAPGLCRRAGDGIG
ncbi:hypothetical protein RZS08_50695, partial [Arthrospira platensis SPKY1]|nr:hypothetical protein [Arthrospira platensis SPKY1]